MAGGNTLFKKGFPYKSKVFGGTEPFFLKRVSGRKAFGTFENLFSKKGFRSKGKGFSPKSKK
ncbi:MAG: hypothetical protein D6805_03305 [Planctomycetota bacterium]|nr:MAG: hypothetical protein D6805_03305 [Planctomycetota bacterium]